MPHRSTALLAGIVVVLCALTAGTGGTLGAAQAPPASEPTYARDVAPILNRNCVTCHRPGEAAPMSLMTYRDVRPWARAIDKAVAGGIMPPWHADAPAGTFENERRLTAGEKATIARWVAAGAPEGDPAQAPASPSFADGWRIGAPDAVFEMAESYDVPARGTIQYEYFYIPANLTDVKWVQAIEVRPGNRALVHHVLVYYQAPPDPGAGLPPIRPNPQHNRLPAGGTRGSRPPQRLGQRALLATYAPGTDPQVFRPGTAVRLPPGGTIELQMHYTANGTAGSDRTKVGIVFAKERPEHEIRVSQFLNAQFTIPAGSPDYRVDTDLGFAQDVVLWGLFPHTHVRGKKWEYVLALPDGTMKPLLSVPKYDFNWQTYYMFKEPLRIPAGARILSSAWYDNSAANRSNPDATMDVKWGDQTWEEMQYTGLLYSVPQPAKVASR